MTVTGLIYTCLKASGCQLHASNTSQSEHEEDEGPSFHFRDPVTSSATLRFSATIWSIFKQRGSLRSWFHIHLRAASLVLATRCKSYLRSWRVCRKQITEVCSDQKHVRSRCSAACSLLIHPPSIRGEDAVRLYWGGAGCVSKVMTWANSCCPFSRQTINAVNDCENHRKRPRLLFPGCKRFNVTLPSSRPRPFHRPTHSVLTAWWVLMLPARAKWLITPYDYV